MCCKWISELIKSCLFTKWFNHAYNAVITMIEHIMDILWKKKLSHSLLQGPAINIKSSYYEKKESPEFSTCMVNCCGPIVSRLWKTGHVFKRLDLYSYCHALLDDIPACFVVKLIWYCMSRGSEIHYSIMTLASIKACTLIMMHVSMACWLWNLQLLVPYIYDTKHGHHFWKI